MWPALTILVLVSLVALHVLWRRKFRRAQITSGLEAARLRREHEATAAEVLARQDALFDSMIEGVLVLDDASCVQFANRAFAQMFATTGVLRGRALLETVRLPEIVELVRRVGQEGRVIDHELWLPGEAERWLQINAAALTGIDRRRLGTIIVFHDLTRIKRLEHTRQEFVANVSHELRTPLSLIKGYAETLLDGAKDNPEVAVKFLQSIDRNARRLDFLIQDLLTISALESGRVTLKLQPVAVRRLTDEIFAGFKARAEARRVSLVNALPELIAHADADRLEQVLGNLLDNAVKYGREGGTVTVGGRATGDGGVELCVQDDGPGLSPEAVQRVFERFFRVDKARSREQGGTGLGLAIVKHIVQSHGGRVWVESEPGHGAKFLLTLPAAGIEPPAGT